MYLLKSYCDKFFKDKLEIYSITYIYLGNNSKVANKLYRNFQPFSSHGTPKLITKLLRHTKKCIFCQSNKIGIILIHSQQTTIVLLAVVMFLYDNLREQRPVPQVNSQILHVLKILAAHQMQITVTDTFPNKTSLAS